MLAKANMCVGAPPQTRLEKTLALYHFRGTIVKRSEGRSVVAAAAYRAAERLVDQRQGRVWNYTRKERVLHTEILLPDIGGPLPGFTKSRSDLWNAVEATEKRKDSQVAREIRFALPMELNPDDRLALARSFVLQQFVDRGMIADLAIHDTADGNPHAHVMLATRADG